MGEKRMDDEFLMTEKEIAERTQMSERWVRKARTKMGLPYLKLGGYVRFRWSDVKLWLDERQVGNSEQR